MRLEKLPRTPAALHGRAVPSIAPFGTIFVVRLAVAARGKVRLRQEPVLHLNVLCLIELAVEGLTNAQPKQLIVVVADLVVNAGLEVKYVVCRVANVASVQLWMFRLTKSGAPPEWLTTNWRRIQLLWRLCEEYRIRPLTWKLALCRAYHPFEISADVVSPIVQREYVQIRSYTIVCMRPSGAAKSLILFRA